MKPTPKKPATPQLGKPQRRQPRQPVSITIEPGVLAWVDERADNRSEQISQDLTRYYRLLAETRRSIRDRLTPADLSAIIDVQNGHIYRPGLLDGSEIWANVEDAIRLDGLAEKWEIDGPKLVSMLRELDLWQVHALADATQRFWHAVGEGDGHHDPARALD